VTGPYLRRVTRSVAFYPVTVVYVSAVVDLAAIVGGAVRLDIGLVLLALLAVVVILLSMRREVSNVHALVNSQHDALVASAESMGDRIDQLIAALNTAGVPVPHDEAGVDRG
jgi:hypothetical protein